MVTADTVQLAAVRAEARQLTADTEETQTAALVADLGARVEGIRRLAPSRGDAGARQALLEELARLVADAQQLTGHLTEAERAARDAVHDAAFTDWLTAPGGRR